MGPQEGLLCDAVLAPKGPPPPPPPEEPPRARGCTYVTAGEFLQIRHARVAAEAAIKEDRTDIGKPHKFSVTFNKWLSEAKVRLPGKS